MLLERRNSVVGIIFAVVNVVVGVVVIDIVVIDVVVIDVDAVRVTSLLLNIHVVEGVKVTLLLWLLML